MKKTTLLILSILIRLNLFSQNEIHSVKLTDEYSWRNHSQSELNEFYLNIEPIKNSVFKYHFQHKREGQIINIYSENGESFSGELINSITEYKDIKTDFGKNPKADKYLYEKVKLNTKNASDIGRMVINQKLYNIPTDTLIEGWNFGWLDCGSVSFTFKTENKFQFSEYTCHQNQNDSIVYVPMIKNAFDTIDKILELEKKYSEFESKLGKGKTYSKNGYVMMYLMTKKQSLVFQKSKPQREYLKSIKDTIDKYLESEITKKKMQFKKNECFEDYQLTFNENGKLKKIKVADYEKPKLSDGFEFYFEDKREIRKCKKLIKQIFKEINLNSFNLKYQINRILSFGLENEVQLQDNTIY